MGNSTSSKAIKKFMNPVRSVVRRLRLFHAGLNGNQSCQACGFRGRFNTGKVLWPGLIEEWELTPEWVDWFDLREGQSCPKCGSSLRAGQLSDAIIETIGNITAVTEKSLKAVFNQKNVQALKIAEINSAGTLHQFLAKSSNLHYSEYGSNLKEVPSEDLMNLSYSDNSFDLVVTSETLEHVPDIDVALQEIHRVLKPNGRHIFTVPIIIDRAETRQRACIQDNILMHLLSPSYHGAVNEGKSDFLVFYEFGSDFIERCEGIGFEVSLKRDHANPALIAFMTRKVASKNLG